MTSKHQLDEVWRERSSHFPFLKHQFVDGRTPGKFLAINLSQSTSEKMGSYLQMGRIHEARVVLDARMTILRQFISDSETTRTAEAPTPVQERSEGSKEYEPTANLFVHESLESGLKAKSLKEYLDWYVRNVRDFRNNTETISYNSGTLDSDAAMARRSFRHVLPPTPQGTNLQVDFLKNSIPRHLINQVTVSKKLLVNVGDDSQQSAYLELTLPHDVKTVFLVCLSISSLNPGIFPDHYSEQPEAGTWFELGVKKAREDTEPELPRHKIQQNFYSSVVPRLHNIVVNEEDSDDKAWLQKLRTGDVLQLYPRARVPGWINSVSEATMEVQYIRTEEEFYE